MKKISLLTFLLIFLTSANLLAQSDEKTAIETGVGKYNRGWHKQALELLWPLRKSKQFTGEAEFCLGQMFQYGEGGAPENYDEAKDWFKRAAKDGFADGYAELGIMYHYGRGVKKNEKEAVKYYQKAAELNGLLGQYLLSSEYSSGTTLPKNDAEAARLLTLGADRGDLSSRLALGNLYLSGIGVEKDTAKAIKLFMQVVAQQRVPDWANGTGYGVHELNALGYSEETGRPMNAADEIALGIEAGKKTQWAESFRLLSKNINSPSFTDIACNYLGYMYSAGIATEKNSALAVQLYRRSAEVGNAVGQNNLALMTWMGTGTAQDYKEALRWYTKSAEQGDQEGQANLGYMYEKGLGTGVDYKEAVKWYRKSAAQDWNWGQYYLGLAYRNGLGVEQDDTKSQLLLGLAAGHGNKDAAALYRAPEESSPASSNYNYNNSNNSNNSSGTTTQTRVARERICSACGGHGRVVITDRYGNSTTGFCSVCNGTGKVYY